MEYAECEAVVKDYPPFREAMKRRGIEDMDLVMVDPWFVTKPRLSSNVGSIISCCPMLYLKVVDTLS